MTAPIETPLRGFIREFTQDRVAVVAFVVLALIVLLALLAPWITPQDPYDLSNLVLKDARRPPGFVGSKGFTHWLGTDAQGRDLYSGILYGLRISLQVGLMAGAIAFALGASLGTLAGFAGGRTETLIMRIIDLQLSFPAILLALVLAALLGQGKWPLIAALVSNRLHTRILTRVQPARADFDVFPTVYAMNTQRAIRRLFAAQSDVVAYPFTPEPAYHFGSPLLYRVMQAVHKHLPDFLATNLFIFARKHG